MQEIYDFLKKCGTYYLATVDGDKPKVRPFGTIMLYESKLYIQTGKIKPTSRQLHANPNVEICAFSDGTWLRLSGKLIEDDRRIVKKQMLDEYPELRGMYNEDDGNTEVFYFVEGIGTFYSFTSKPKTIKI